ncbi:MAG TPA: nickel-dependent hydrogenase large subunit [Gammaproteobacteria bacterium]
MTEQRNIKITVPVLARVEGEGALDIELENNVIKHLALRIYEPPRYFEKFLEGRSHLDVPDMVARICGICPVAYQMSAVKALEQAFDFTPSQWTLNMRRLMYCGEWIQSHSLHIHLLAAPDFLGFDNALEMSVQHPQIVQRGLRLQNLGNEIIRFLGGRSVHPVGVVTGGFHKAPSMQDAQNLLAQLQDAKDDCHSLIDWTCSLNLPDNSQDIISVSMFNEDEYPMYHGQIKTSQGLLISAEEFEQHFIEHHEPHSTALHALHNGKPYLVGPLARINLNHELIPADTLALLKKHSIVFPSNNIFHSIIARAIELQIAISSAAHILKHYFVSTEPVEKITTRASTGFSFTEAPRGLLWHKYTTDNQGYISYAKIVPPTSQNQAQMESDLRFSIMNFGLNKDDDELRHYSETIIRNYDPCISCATHFLKLKVNR